MAEEIAGTGVPEPGETIIAVEIIPAPEKQPGETDAQRRARESAERQVRRLRQKERDSVTSLKFDSKIEASKSEALDILSRRVRNPHVAETAYHLGVIAAEKLGLTLNKFYWQNGVQHMLISQEKKEAIPLEMDHAVEVPGEVIHRGDLFAIYDFGVSWQEPVTFEEFLAIRYKCKTSAYELGLLLGKDFHQCHKDWTDFAVRFKPTLRPGYTQNDMKRWLGEQSKTKDYLLLSSRNAYKSSWIAVWAITMILCCPDTRILFVSETNRLSKGFIRGVRSYFTRGGEAGKFQTYFPEFVVDPDDDSTLSYNCPLRHLGLIQSTAEATSMESSTVGQRADAIVFDDPISNQTVGTEEMCDKSNQTHSAIKKLREVGGYSVVIGTPWRANIDLYAVLIEKNTDNSMKVRIDPAWKTKPQFRYKDVRQLKEEDIESFLFPERLDWKFLQGELKDDSTPNKSFFKSQNLVEWTPAEEDLWRITFDRGVLDAHIRPIGAFSEAEKIYNCMAIDVGYSTSRYADPTAIVVAQILRWRNRPMIFVTDVKYERWKISEIATEVVNMLQKHPDVDRCVSEKIGAWESLQDTIVKAGQMRGVRIPNNFYWKPVSAILTPGTPAKVARIKALEPLLADEQLWFAADGTWNDYLLGQFEKFDGVHKSSGTRKDDGVDSLALLAESFFPWPSGYAPQKSPEELEEERMRDMNAWSDAIYKRMHGMAPGTQQWSGPLPSTESETEYVNPLTATLQRFGMYKEN